MTQGTGEEGNKKAGLSGSQVKENVINEVEVQVYCLGCCKVKELQNKISQLGRMRKKQTCERGMETKLLGAAAKVSLLDC